MWRVSLNGISLASPLRISPHRSTYTRADAGVADPYHVPAIPTLRTRVRHPYEATPPITKITPVADLVFCADSRWRGGGGKKRGREGGGGG